MSKSSADSRLDEMSLHAPSSGGGGACYHSDKHKHMNQHKNIKLIPVQNEHGTTCVRGFVQSIIIELLRQLEVFEHGQ